MPIAEWVLTFQKELSHIPHIYLSAYARQPARGPTMLAHFVASWGYVGLS